MKMGDGGLHQELKNLCVNTDWNYAVFWKFNQQTRMTLTWEDAYYDKNDRLGSPLFDSMNDMYAQDLLGLAVAKMSCRVYSLGEGKIGRVAGTGKHIWISEDELANNSCYSNERFDDWETQFSAGVRTIVGIPVIPYGVVELGSFNNMSKDLKLLNRVQETFFELQKSLSGLLDSSPCVSTLSTRSSGSRSLSDHINNHQEPKYLTSDIIELTPCNDQNVNFLMPGSPNRNPNESFKFPAGCELFEALGPAFCKKNNNFVWGTEIPKTVKSDGAPGGPSDSDVLTETSGTKHLLEAVVANVCCSDSGLVRLQPPPCDQLTSGSVCYSYKGSVHDPKTSVEPCGSPNGFSSVSRCSGPAKVGKKRARPGESCRPRPRDRQLIQDRIKELRELVPNGSKCSIDSLLERTIKHMVFMQCMMKHAEKIDKYAEFKLLGNGPSGQDHGSSWAMEVGNDPKVCPIMVENIGINGQMLVEMMCDECVGFLEITEAIRSLGLTILKGVTNTTFHGDKTWMCFVVEGETNRSMHRVDILWSLVQILHSKTMSSA